MKIGVYGSAAGDMGDEVREKAREIGRQIALGGHTLITGACTGLPYDAVLGAIEYEGEIIGFSPGVDLQDHITRFKFPTEGFTRIVYIPTDYTYRGIKQACTKYRNVVSVAECDAGVIISGRCGTLNEFTNLYDMGRNIGVLEGTGGMTKFIRDLVKDWNKPSASQIVYSDDPKELIFELEKLAKKNGTI